LNTIILIFLFALLVDGIKTLIESFSSYKTKRYLSDHSQISVVIPLYNKEQEIAQVLASVTKHFRNENIFVVNDGSTDNSLNVAKRVAPDVNFSSIKNRGKVRAIESVLYKIQTPLVLILDADVVLPENFQCPTSLINDEITAIAFNVMPEYNPSGNKNLILEFQSHEYAKSMQIGRKFQDRIKSVHCISGAIGLFKIKRLWNFTQKHSKVWPGEDLERTLIELVSGGKIVYVNQVIKTSAPKTIGQLIKQRVAGWWPGLWRNIPLFFKLLFKRKIPAQLRLEIGYQLFSLFTDPLKLLSLIALLVTGNWIALGALFLIYFALEAIIHLRMKNGYTKRPITVIALYFFYNLLQIVLRLGGLMKFFWNRVVKKRWMGVMTSFLLLIALLLPANSLADDGIFSVSYQKIVDSHGRNLNNCNLYFGYKGFYLDTNTAKQAPKYLIVGQYFQFKKITMLPEIRIKEFDQALKLTLQRPILKPIVIRASISYTFSKAIDNFPTLQLGSDYYWGDYNYFSLDIIKEFGRKRAATLIVKHHLEFKNGIYLKTGVAINNFWNVGCFAIIGFKQLFLGYSSFQNFDYYEFDRKYLTAGIKLKF